MSACICACLSGRRATEDEWFGGGRVANSRFAPSAYHPPFSSGASDCTPPDCCPALIETTLRHACFCFPRTISDSILEGLAHTVVIWTRSVLLQSNGATWFLYKCSVHRYHKEAFSQICCDLCFCFIRFSLGLISRCTWNKGSRRSGAG